MTLHSRQHECLLPLKCLDLLVLADEHTQLVGRTRNAGRKSIDFGLKEVDHGVDGTARERDLPHGTRSIIDDVGLKVDVLN